MVPSGPIARSWRGPPGTGSEDGGVTLSSGTVPTGGTTTLPLMPIFRSRGADSPRAWPLQSAGTGITISSGAAPRVEDDGASPPVSPAPHAFSATMSPTPHAVRKDRIAAIDVLFIVSPRRFV